MPIARTSAAPRSWLVEHLLEQRFHHLKDRGWSGGDVGIVRPFGEDSGADVTGRDPESRCAHVGDEDDAVPIVDHELVGRSPSGAALSGGGDEKAAGEQGSQALVHRRPRKARQGRQLGLVRPSR